jgi:hypothetical protein
MAVSWFTCQSDQILRKPFNPFIYFLKNYFEQSPENTPKKTANCLSQIFSNCMYELTESRHPEADAVRREISPYAKCAGGPGRYSVPGSLWEQLDARGRYQNALSAMANLLVAESILQPAVIELEDAHWYDDMSREFLAQFIRRAQGYPLLFLATSRYEDDGSKAYIFRHNSAGQKSKYPHGAGPEFPAARRPARFCRGPPGWQPCTPICWNCSSA